MSVYIYQPSKHRRSGSAMQKQAWRGSKAYRASRETVMDGYPMTEPFATREQISRYLDADKIACLICGRAFAGLPPHIKRVHGVDAADYKSRFGLPQQTPLMGKARLQKAVALGRSDENIKRLSILHLLARRRGPSRRANVPCVKDEMIARVKGGRGRIYGDFPWHLEKMSKIWRCWSIEPPPGVGSWSTFLKRMKNEPALRDRARRARATFRSRQK